MRHNKLFKSMLVAMLLTGMAVPLQAQMVSNNNDDEVNKVDPSAPKYRPGQVIVKLRENSSVNLNCENGKLKSTGVSAIDKVMTTLGITEAEKLMPLTGDIKNRAPRKAKALSGREIVEPNLSKLYCLKFEENEERNVLQAVEMLKSLKDVEFAEPNYLAFIQSTEESTTYQAEPYYSQQWGLNAINMPQLWEMPKTDETRPIIAILDTGVDITHPDLEANIWTNPNEATGADYEDDDNNGYVDDVHGWDFVAGTAIIGNGMDRNGHGTHCAGIAAAVGNNGIGITGANPDALILPIKVMGDNGTGDVATICRGIDYATACGANVLSMSFGGPASTAEYQALCKTLTNYEVLVGAAGNDSKDINIYEQRIPSPAFPGAYDIVLGVMASGSDGQLALFSNYDPDGPFFSDYNTKNYSSEVNWNEEMMWNYDLMAPGVGIMSTYLNGSYKSLSGTSMATPMVAGAISRILQVKGFEYARDYGLMGDMAIAKDGGICDLAVFNAYQAASYDETNRQVVLTLTALDIDDSEGDGDGRFDAGETISIWPTIRSLWGYAQNIKMSLVPGENMVEGALEILDNDVDFGWTLNSRGSFKSKNPIRVKVNENANDGLHLPYIIVITSDNLLANIEQEHVFEVENGVELGGVINEDMTLYPNIHYIATNNILIPDGKTLTIYPGTKIDFKNKYGLVCAQPTGRPSSWNNDGGHIIMKGTNNALITIINCNNFFSNPTDTIYYTQFVSSCAIAWANFNNCIVKNCNSGYYPAFASVYGGWVAINNLYNSNIICNGDVSSSYPTISLSTIVHKSNICNNFLYYSNPQYYLNYSNTSSSNILNNDACNFGYDSSDIGIQQSTQPCYFGSSLESVVRAHIWDYESGHGNSIIDLSNMLTRPTREAHGIVWKVVVDGYDAQDEFDLLPPLGVGRHKFEVFYNRDDIDTTSRPKVSMGLRQPYTQTPIDKDGFWCVKDSASVYTVYLDITGKTNCDGLNRIKVTGGKDHDHFDIPDEYWRFNVLVQAAGSMATGFEAEAGMGNVKLTWNNENNDFEDAMGFNVYRYTMLNDSVAGDTIRLNQTILDIEATQYIDYEVTPNETYYYYYKVLSTDLKEYDISNVVAATPLTSTLGDANASGEVDVADVITTVNYAAGMEPRPFIFEAADVNADQDIDILDVIGIIKIITRPNAAATASIEGCAIYSIEDGIVWVDSPIDLAGVQLTLNADQDATITPTETLNGFEQVGAWMDENSYLFLAYNMGGRVIPAGKQPILNIGDAEITDIHLSDRDGHNILATPAEEVVTGIGVLKPEVQKSRMQGIYDMTGRRVAASAAALDRLPRGIYIVNGVKVVK